MTFQSEGRGGGGDTAPLFISYGDTGWESTLLEAYIGLLLAPSMYPTNPRDFPPGENQK